MKVCLRMYIEGALWELFNAHGMNLEVLLVEIIRDWKNENYLGMVQNATLAIEHLQGQAFAILLFVEVRIADLINATVENLENSIVFDLAVRYHQGSGGDRCHLRDLHFAVLPDRLE
uniref:ORF3 n=1 Tax=Simian adenovirus 13 TaxID=38432 RepID=A0A1W5PVA5_9ADEN|nr:ORF3 [Simian adenovirus 13]